MKTFNEKDIITWSNRHDAKIKTSGYCANSINELKQNIKNNITRMLSSISDDYELCFNCCTLDNYDVLRYGFFLPKDAVKEDKPREKRYRPFKDLYEFYKFLSPNSDLTREDFNQNMLLGLTFTYKEKNKGLFTAVDLITRVEYGTVGGCNVISVNTRVLDYWFNKYEIMNTNGEWKPFGVEA